MWATLFFYTRRSTLILLFLSLAFPVAAGDTQERNLSPLPPAPAQNPSKVEIGRILFHDLRLAGDATTSCSYCHIPSKSFSDGIALSIGYPSTLYFRNTPSLYNTVFKEHLYWDGRFPGKDLTSVIRDHLAEAHFMNSDGRLLIEKMRQVPEYEKTFRNIYEKDPTYSEILDVLAAYVRSLVSQDSPFDRYLKGDKRALGRNARKGYTLFIGKAGCVRCHNGPLLSDGGFHNRNVPENPQVIANPIRHITFRRFFKDFGMREYARLREDVGLYAVTKKSEDHKKFKTPSLREVAKTAPYMHNGIFKTLSDVVAFEGPDLSQREVGYITAFLKTLTGSQESPATPVIPKYAARSLRPHPQEKTPPVAPQTKKTTTPENFPPLGPLPPLKIPSDNPITERKVMLGQMLYFDTRNSGNRSIHCGLCHNPSLGWGDDYDIAQGYPGTQHWRNSQTLLNSAYFSKLSWDGSKSTLEEQIRIAIIENIAGNGDPSMIEERLAQAPIYVSLFKEVFGTDRPQFEGVVKAIAAFTRSVPISKNVPFDRYARGEKNALSDSAKRGLELFNGKAGCIQCHNGPLLSDEDFHATGVPENPIFEKDPLVQVALRFERVARGASEDIYRGSGQDLGLFLSSKRNEDMGKFRTQTLRELTQTQPYMHNGVFWTLPEVIEFYNKGAGDHPNKSPKLRPLNLSAPEKEDLLAFLKSLSGDPIPAKIPLLPGYPGTTHK